MARGKLKLEYISNDVVRRATLKKRRKGLIKKVNDLSTLCGVEACVIVFESKSHDAEPEIWPSPMGVQSVLDRFNKYTGIDRTKKMLDQQAFLQESIKKGKEKLVKIRKDNRVKEMTLYMNEFVGTGEVPKDLDFADLNDLKYVIDRKVCDIERQLEKLKLEDEKKKEMMVNKNQDVASSSSFLPGKK